MDLSTIDALFYWTIKRIECKGMYQQLLLFFSNEIDCSWGLRLIVQLDKPLFEAIYITEYRESTHETLDSKPLTIWVGTHTVCYGKVRPQYCLVAQVWEVTSGALITYILGFIVPDINTILVES